MKKLIIVVSLAILSVVSSADSNTDSNKVKQVSSSDRRCVNPKQLNIESAFDTPFGVYEEDIKRSSNTILDGPYKGFYHYGINISRKAGKVYGSEIVKVCKNYSEEEFEKEFLHFKDVLEKQFNVKLDKVSDTLYSFRNDNFCIYLSQRGTVFINISVRVLWYDREDLEEAIREQELRNEEV